MESTRLHCITFLSVVQEHFSHFRGGCSKLIERGSYRVKGASGVFRMRERGARRSGAGSPPVGSRGKAPVGGEVPQKLKLFC